MDIEKLYKTTVTIPTNKYEYQLDETCIVRVQLLDYDDKPVTYTPVKIFLSSLREEKKALYKDDNEYYKTNSQGYVDIPIVRSEEKDRVPETYTLTCNGKSVRWSHDGWFEVASGTYYILYYSLRWVKVVFRNQLSNANTNWKVIEKINYNEEYANFPLMPITTTVKWGSTVNVMLDNSGTIRVRLTTGTWSNGPGLNAELTYPRVAYIKGV